MAGEAGKRGREGVSPRCGEAGTSCYPLRVADSGWGGRIFAGLFVLIALVCTGTAAVRAADIAWKSAWIVAH